MKGMKQYVSALLLCVLVMAAPQSGAAQEALGEVTDEPLCFSIINEAPYTVMGTLETNYFIRADGVKTRHRENFRLAPQDWKQFCSRGPFFDGRRLDIVLKSLVPLFECRTALYEDLRVQGRYKDEDEGGGTETWIECLDP